MRRSLTLGRVAAIPIRLHWSWLLIFVLLLVALRPAYALTVCGGTHICGPDVGLAALMSALVGVSVVLHELGHALVAARVLVPVHTITLFAFGGVAELDADAPSPSAEFAIAVAGPAVSLLLALGAGLVWWARDGLATPDALAILMAHLALANGVMALFNLLPGYPMDGGRVLRATLWFFADDLLPATRIAAQVGRACGIVIGIGGLIMALAAAQSLLECSMRHAVCSTELAAAQTLAGLWACLVGGFLYRMASTSYRQLVLQTALRDVSVGDLMQRRMHTVPRELTLEQFVARFVLGHAETGFAVVESFGGEAPRLVGMINLRHLRRFTTTQWSKHQVAEAMTPLSQIVALSPQTPVLAILSDLATHPDGLLPVLEGQRLVGLLRRRDVAVYVNATCNMMLP